MSFEASDARDLYKAMELVLDKFPNIRFHGITPQTDRVEVPKTQEPQQEQQASPVIASVPDPPQRKRRKATPKAEAPNGGKSWGVGDINFLLNNHLKMSDERLAKELGRTVTAVQWQKWKMDQDEAKG